MDKKDVNSYRNIFKATSLFGGVQIWKILIGMVAQKSIAILIGPEGVGIMGLLQSGLNFVQGITSMGLSQSAVKNVSEANSTGDDNRVGVVVSAFRRIVWITGLLGAVTVALLSPVLSYTSFNNYDYTLPFLILALTMLFNQLSAGQLVVLQGMRKIHSLAKASLLGSLFGLLISVPIYYFLRIDGIVPTIILQSLSALLLSWYFSRKVEIKKVAVTISQAFKESGDMLKMGFALSFNSILVTGVAYATRAIIGRMGGIDEVGLYVAGTAIVQVYINLVFNAMSTDYFPRLAGFNNDNMKCCNCINQQSEIGVLLLTPILMVFIILAPLLLVILYSEKFIPITGFMLWAIYGTLFKVSSWAISYVFIAKGAMRMFLINEITIQVLTLPLNIISYYYWGLTGLGIAVLVSYLIYLGIVYYNANRNYDFFFSKAFFKLFAVDFLLLTICFVSCMCFSNIWGYAICTTIFICCAVYSYRELRIRLSLRKSQ